jgi:hypothetical protein
MATISRAAAITAYASAVTSFRTARANLDAADRALGLQGFGLPGPDVIELRHSAANPSESGSLGDDTRASFNSNTFTA